MCRTLKTWNATLSRLPFAQAPVSQHFGRGSGLSGGKVQYCPDGLLTAPGAMLPSPAAANEMASGVQPLLSCAAKRASLAQMKVLSPSGPLSGHAVPTRPYV